MKINHFKLYFILLISAILIVSCDDKSDNLGKTIQPTEDRIYISTDTFHLSTKTLEVESIVSRPDSFLLGTYIDEMFGTTTADFMSQLILPKEGYKFLDPTVATTKVDSIVLGLGIGSFFGEPNSPIKIDVYELNKALENKKDYKSDTDLTKYADMSTPIGSAITTAVDEKTNSVNSVRIKFTDEFVNRFFTTDPNVYKSNDSFQNYFKGLFITTNFGSSSILNVRNVIMSVYFKSTYLANNDVINNYLTFPVTSEVKSVNRVLHPIKNPKILADNEYNYMFSPAKYYTKIRVPIQRMKDRVFGKLNGKELSVNSASLRINVLDRDSVSKNTFIPYIGQVLLVKADSKDRFFNNSEMPSDTCAFIGTIQQENITPVTYRYYYNFPELTKLIENELKRDKTAQYVDFLLVPISTKYTKSGGNDPYSSNQTQTLSEVNEVTQLRGTTIFGGNNSQNPMRIELVYSGF